jgi:hypothetical protein
MSSSVPACFQDFASQAWQEAKSTSDPSVSVIVIFVTRVLAQAAQVASRLGGVVTRDKAGSSADEGVLTHSAQ